MVPSGSCRADAAVLQRARTVGDRAAIRQTRRVTGRSGEQRSPVRCAISCIAATTLSEPASTSPDMVGLRSSQHAAPPAWRWSRPRPARTPCSSSCARRRCPSVASTAGQMLLRVAVRLPSWTLSIAPLMAPHSEWPRTRISLAPASLGRELQAADDVGVDEIAGDPGREHAAEPLVEDQLRRHPGIDAADDGGDRRLPGGCRLDLRQEIAIDGLAREQPGVAVHQPLQRLIRRLGALPGGVEHHAIVIRECRAGSTEQRQGRDEAEHGSTIAAAHGMIPRLGLADAMSLADRVSAPQVSIHGRGHRAALWPHGRVPIVDRQACRGGRGHHGHLSHRLRAQPRAARSLLGRGRGRAALGPALGRACSTLRRRPSIAGSPAAG